MSTCHDSSLLALLSYKSSNAKTASKQQLSSAMKEPEKNMKRKQAKKFQQNNSQDFSRVAQIPQWRKIVCKASSKSREKTAKMLKRVMDSFLLCAMVFGHSLFSRIFFSTSAQFSPLVQGKSKNKSVLGKKSLNFGKVRSFSVYPWLHFFWGTLRI